MTPRQWLPTLAAVTGSAMVGTMPLVARQLYAAGLGAPSMLFWRYAIAVLALAVAVRLSGHRLREAWPMHGWRIVLVGATLGAAQTFCYWESIKTLETSVAVMLFYTYPALTLVLDRVVFKQSIRPLALGCVAMILLGAALITLPGLQGGSLDPRGLAWALPAPLIYAVYLAITARLLRRHPPLIGAGLLFGGMSLTFAVTALSLGLEIPTGSTPWVLVLFIALGPGALWMILFTYSAPRLGASSFAILANVELVTVVGIGIAVLGEPVTPGRVLGGALILAGILTHALGRKARHSDALPARAEREGPVAPAMGG